MIEQPLRPDRPARFLVVGQMQLDRPGERPGERLQRKQGVGIGGKVALRHRHAAAIHPTVPDLGAVGIGGPALARRHHVAVRVQRDRRSRAEPLAHDQIGCADHAVRLHQVLGHRVPLHAQPELLEQYGRALGMTRAVARRIVRGHFDQLGEQARLRPVLPGAELGERAPEVEVACHAVKLPPPTPLRQPPCASPGGAGIYARRARPLSLGRSPAAGALRRPSHR